MQILEKILNLSELEYLFMNNKLFITRNRKHCVTMDLRYCIMKELLDTVIMCV